MPLNTGSTVLVNKLEFLAFAHSKKAETSSHERIANQKITGSFLFSPHFFLYEIFCHFRKSRGPTWTWRTEGHILYGICQKGLLTKYLSKIPTDNLSTSIVNSSWSCLSSSLWKNEKGNLSFITEKENWRCALRGKLGHDESLSKVKALSYFSAKPQKTFVKS